MFKLKDPRGKVIILTKKCWDDHIVVEHPIMKHFYDELKEVIRDTDYIYQSKISKDAELFFKEFESRKFGELYLLAVIERKEERGYIKTSFPVYNLKKGGELIWKRE